MAYSSMMPVDPSVSIEEVEELLEVMRRQESGIYRRNDYIAASEALRENVVDATWRQRIVEWMYGVVDHCSLRRDSVAIATFYLDICVDRGLIDSRQDFQLAAMTALQLAIKLYDSTVVKLDSMVKLGRGLFTEEDVVAMESKMLSSLGWQVHPPTPVCFLRQYLRLLPVSVAPMTRYMIAEVTRFISEISVCLYKFIKYPPSVLAYAGMLLAMQRLDLATLPMWQRQQIFTVMAKSARVDVSSPAVMEAVAQLQSSLEKNISLKELMDTIDAQRHVGYGNVRVNDYEHGAMSSPRDVR